MSECGKCGQEHVAALGGPPCHGHISTGRKGQPRNPRAGQPCRAVAVKGMTVCQKHGAGSPQARAKSKRSIEEARVQRVARQLIPDADQRTPITNPLERLLELASEADAFRESLRHLANDIDKIRYRGGGAAGAEQLRAEVSTYRAALRDVTDMLVAIAKLDIEKMLARVTLAQAEQALASVRAGMEEAGLTDEQKRTVMTSAGRHLRAVAG